MEICDKKVCTGCGLCASLCPRKCIQLCEDAIGHLYPVIDWEKCIDCHVCTKNCVANGVLQTCKAQKVYASWSLDENEREKSASGGIASVMGKEVLVNGGVVYGAALTEEGIKHIRVSCVQDLHLLQGTKYVQSPIVDCLHDIKEDLVRNQRILFIGTPCQCAAVRSLAKGREDNLLIVDLICTGVPPQKLLWEHIGTKEIDSISFRDGNILQLSCWSKGKIFHQLPVWKDTFLMGFAKHLFFRESCHKCRFASSGRVSDITIGDFWKLGKKVPFHHNTQKGVSVVFVNSEKGKSFFNTLKKDVFYEERTLDEAIGGNPRYDSPSAAHKNRQLFIEQYSKKGFEKALNDALRMERMKYFLVSCKKTAEKTFYGYLADRRKQ